MGIIKNTLYDFSKYYTDLYEYDRFGKIENIKEKVYRQPNSPKDFFKEKGYCPFCKEKIPSVYEGTKGEYPIVIFFDVWECPHCGWWEYSYKFKEEKDLINEVDNKIWHTLNYGILKEFNVSDKHIPIETVISELEKNKSILYEINPYKLEDLVGQVFSSYYNCEVKHVGKTGDGGIDLIMINSDSPILVQVKRRTKSGHIELVSPIREFVGALFVENVKKGVFLSTAKRYSKGAQEIRNKLINNRQLDYFELINFDEFISIFDVIKKDDFKPWAKLVKEYGFEI